MTIVFDNIIFFLQRAGGISLYWSALLKRASQSKKYEFVCYEPKKKSHNIFYRDFSLPKRYEINLPIILLRYLPFTKKVEEYAIFHSSYYRVALGKKVINITTVHDFTYEYYFKGLLKWIHILQKRFAITHSDGIICVSENTKKDLLHFFPHLDESKIRVIYHGLSEDFFPLPLEEKKEKLASVFPQLVDKKYVLYVGDRTHYKNFSIAVEAVKQLPLLVLVVAGGKKLSLKEKRLIRDIEEKIIFFRGVSSQMLNILYNNAHCLIYPSSYEGFGLPVLEAMGSGCPVVCSRSSSLPEVVGNAGILIDEKNVWDYVVAIQNLERSEIREFYREKGLERVKVFSWDNAFKQTVNFYKQVWERRFSKKNSI